MDLINYKGLYKSSANNLPEDQRDRIRVDDKSFEIGVDYDLVDVTYPTNITEVFTYSLDGTVVRIIQVTYLAAVKRDIDKVEVLFNA